MRLVSGILGCTQTEAERLFFLFVTVNMLIVVVSFSKTLLFLLNVFKNIYIYNLMQYVMSLGCTVAAV